MEIKSKGDSTKSRVGIFLLLFSIAYSISDRDRYPREYYEWEKREFKKLGMTYMDQERVYQGRTIKETREDFWLHRTAPDCRKIRLQGFMHPKEKLLNKRAVGEVNQILKYCGHEPFEIVEEIYEYYKLEKAKEDPVGQYPAYHIYTFGRICVYDGGTTGRSGETYHHTIGKGGIHSSYLLVASKSDMNMPWEIGRVPVFRHEFLHALGLRHTDYSGSIMSQFHLSSEIEFIYNYSEFDRLMVEMLHNRLMHGGKSEWGWNYDLFHNHFRRPDRRSRGMRLRYPVLYKKDLSELRKKWEKEEREYAGDDLYDEMKEKWNAKFPPPPDWIKELHRP